ncbi:hypothetical protein EWM64_g4745 [Hericium alpestre]|uniref:Uncharacterized protein n=1 Tax=Hericium alpestre TaxID=135208 RepID=A0A4Y9ZWK3_9AGAM|nr:hypothetical protein EWM64_g4745 [Hericium alpestre]
MAGSGKARAGNAAKPPVRKSRLASLGKPPGHVPFIIGHRLEFCKHHVSGWQEAAASDPPKTGLFYDKTANAYLQEIGYDFDVDSANHIIPLSTAPKEPVDGDQDEEGSEGENEPEGDQPMPARAGPSTGLDTEAVAERNSAKWKALRLALGHWFRNNGNGPGKKQSHSALGKRLDAMVDMAPEKPRRAHADQLFSSKYYDLLVKDRFDTHFQTVASAWQTAQAIPQAPNVGGLPSDDQLAVLAGVTFEGDDLFQAVYNGWRQSFAKKGGKLVEVTLRAAFTRAVYSSQLDDFKEGLKQELDDVYGKAMETYRQLLESADGEKTPEYYHEMQSKAAYFLYPFAEHASKKLGLNVSIMVYGPISARGGAIGVKSVHVGSTNDAMSLEWMDADPEAYQAMVNSMKAFGNRCFTKEDRAARAFSAIAPGPSMDREMEEEASGPTGASDKGQDAASLHPRPASTGADGRLPLPSFSITRPSRTASQPAPPVAPSVNVPSRRFISAPTAGFITQLNHPAASQQVPIDPRLQAQPASASRYPLDDEPDGLRTPPSSPLIPDDEPLVGPSFPNMQANPQAQPYVRRLLPSPSNRTSRQLDEHVWAMLEDKREEEWNALHGIREHEPSESDNPFVSMDLTPMTPARTKAREAPA